MTSAVSKTADSRLNSQRLYGKERIAMWRIFAALAITIGAVLGGGGAAVAGAQEAMPEDALYPVKIFAEEVRLWAEGDPLSKMDMALQFADRRAEEIVHQIDAGLPVGDPVIQRLMNQDDMALSLAAQAGDEDAPAALEKVRARLENHIRVLDYLQAGLGPNENALLEQTRQNIRQRLELLSGDLNDPQLRTKIIEQVRTRATQPAVTPAGQTNQNRSGDEGQGSERGPASTQGGGFPPEGTPAPGGGNGQGPEAVCECPTTCEEQAAGGGGKGSGGSTSSGQGGENGCVCPTLICTN
ncbi:MAG: hypothetical protein JW929_06715 [Anaerolineales bacterium]|nr:hypothetical protein [Anaerolineales bacterium]